MPLGLVCLCWLYMTAGKLTVILQVSKGRSQFAFLWAYRGGLPNGFAKDEGV